MILLFKTVLNPAKTMLKSSETSKESQIFFEKNCKNFKLLKKIAKT